MDSLRQARMALAAPEGFQIPGGGQRRRVDLAELTRTYLKQLWADATAQLPSTTGVVLASLGSLARNECGPLSDLDLVLLHDGRGLADRDLAALTDSIWYPLWDCGLELDHATRSKAQYRQIAAADLTVATALLDLQPVAGDVQVVARIRKLLGEDWRASARKRLPELIENVQSRHDSVGDLSQLLAPDLKEARGGLRDMAIMRALATSWLTDRPHGRIDQAYQWLLDIRDAVQVVTGRSRSTLTLADQDDVAELVGVGDADDLLTQVSLAGRAIAQALDETIRRAQQSHLARQRLLGPRIPRMTPVGNGIYIHDHEIVLGRGHDLEDPLLVLQVAAAAAEHGLPISPTTLTNLAERGAVLPRPWPRAALMLFVKVLASPTLVRLWESLDQVGFIDRWLPPWSDIRSRPQRNALHRHTVDRHCVEAVLGAARLLDASPDPTVLLLATLLHDIGKRAKVVDHCAAGAPIAAECARGLGCTEAEVADIFILVGEHLTLADLATNRDVEDPDTAAELLSRIGSRLNLLAQLRLLTQADAVSTRSPAWSTWRATLIDHLTNSASALLPTSS